MLTVGETEEYPLQSDDKSGFNTSQQNELLRLKSIMLYTFIMFNRHKNKSMVLLLLLSVWLVKKKQWGRDWQAPKVRELRKRRRQEGGCGSRLGRLREHYELPQRRKHIFYHILGSHSGCSRRKNATFSAPHSQWDWSRPPRPKFSATTGKVVLMQWQA